MVNNWLPPRDAVTVVGPRIVAAFDVAASFLRTSCCDVAAVIGAVQLVLAATANAYGVSPIPFAVLSAVARGVDGVVALRVLTVNESAADYVGDGFTPYALLPSSIDASGARIAMSL